MHALPQLPDHVLDLVLLHLPFRSLFAARAVCRAWHAKLSDPSFLSVAQCPSFPTPPWSLMESSPPTMCTRLSKLPTVPEHGYSLIATSQNKWVQIPLDVPPEFRFVCAKDGLLCFWDPEKQLLVGNPLTKQWKRIDLPPRRDKNLSFAFIPNSEVGTFKFIVGWGLEISIYNSSTRLWTDRKPRKPSHHSFCFSKEWAVLEKDVLEKVDTLVDSGGHVVTYDIDKDLLDLMVVTRPSLLVSRARIFQSQDHILLVGVFNRRKGLLSFQRPHLRNEDFIGVWQLQWGAPPRWELVAQSPQGVAKRMINEADWCFEFSFSSDSFSSIWMSLSESSLVLQYNMESKQWTLHPNCPIGNKTQTKRDVVSTLNFKRWKF